MNLCDSHYRPQTKFPKVMFLHVSVILSGGGSASVYARIPCPPGAEPPPPGAYPLGPDPPGPGTPQTRPRPGPDPPGPGISWEHLKFFSSFVKGWLHGLAGRVILVLIAVGHQDNTRMHSSRMHTARLLTVSPSMH